MSKLTALRNLVANGQAVASADRKRTEVILHVELLDSFPTKLIVALDDYYESLFLSHDPTMRGNLARAAVDPVLYAEDIGQIPYISPIKYAYARISEPGRKPSQVLRYTDWQLYNPTRDNQ